MSEDMQLSQEEGASSASSASLTDEQTLIYIEVLEYLKSRLPGVAGYVENQAVHIVDEFKSLSSQTLEQSKGMERVVDIATTIELDGEKIPYQKSVEILYEPLAEAITKILQVSKLAMSMVMTIGNAADNIERVEQCIDQVQKLTRQTNMLAMNTQIEAARAGEAGKSFRIIAQEVKALSENIKEISQTMQHEVSQVSGSVKKSSEVVDNLAYYDMTENLQLKDKIDGLINSILDQNKRFSMLLQESAETAQQTASSIGSLVVGIQFQDRTTQVVTDLVSLLEKTIAHLRSENPKQHFTATQDLDRYDALIRDLITNIRLSDVRNEALSHLHAKGAFPADSSIYKQFMEHAQKDGQTATSSEEDDDDDIELF